MGATVDTVTVRRRLRGRRVQRQIAGAAAADLRGSLQRAWAGLALQRLVVVGWGAGPAAWEPRILGPSRPRGVQPCSDARADSALIRPAHPAPARLAPVH